MNNKSTFYSLTGGSGYTLGFIGALAYYFGNSLVFTDYVWGFVKAMFWPGFFVYHGLSFFGA